MKPTKDWLRQKYETEGLDCPAIGRIVSRDAKTVWSWLRAAGIPTRPRGLNNRFAKGQKSAFAGKKHTADNKQKFREFRLSDGHFPKQEDGRPYWAGKTGNQHPTWAGGATPERQAFYATDEWAAARRAAYTNAGGRCQRCGGSHALHIHHVIPFAVVRLRAAPHNLRVLCADCHRFVHSDKNGDREFLPPFAILPTDAGEIRISYRPKHQGALPQWMR